MLQAVYELLSAQSSASRLVFITKRPIIFHRKESLFQKLIDDWVPYREREKGHFTKWVDFLEAKVLQNADNL